jgi:hypothetical protein
MVVGAAVGRWQPFHRDKTVCEQLQQGRVLTNCGGLWQLALQARPEPLAAGWRSCAMLATVQARGHQIYNSDMQSRRPTCHSTCSPMYAGGLVSAALYELSTRIQGTLVKTRIIVALLLICAGTAHSATAATSAGIGVSIQSDDSLIYVPIDFNKKFRLEPSLRYSKEESHLQNDFDLESSSLELGVGLFGLTGVGEKLRIYYGGRLAYVRTEFTSSQLFASDLLGFESFTVQQDADGYRVAPTLGFEFLINDRLSIGGEAEYFYQELDIERFGRNRLQTSGTDTRLIVRFRF